MVDVDLLHGSLLVEKGGDSLHWGVQKLKQVAFQGTAVNRAKAYHQLAQTYLMHENEDTAEMMLDSMYALLMHSEPPTCIPVDYKPILNHYLKSRDQKKVERYVRLMLQEQQMSKDMRLNFNLVEAIVDMKTEQKRQEVKIIQLAQANQRLWMLSCIALAVLAIIIISTFLYHQKKRYGDQMKQVNDKLFSLMQKLSKSNTEGKLRTHEINEYLESRENRRELEALTASH